jgi:hypothetical protein
VIPRMNFSRIGREIFTKEADAAPTVPFKDFDIVSQLGHFAGGIAVISLGTLVCGPKSMWFWFVLVVAGIGIKEAFIDPITESKIVQGSGLLDWASWVGGASVAVFTIKLSNMLWLVWQKFCSI